MTRLGLWQGALLMCLAVIPAPLRAQALGMCEGAGANLSLALPDDALGLPVLKDDRLTAGDVTGCCSDKFCLQFNHVTNMPGWVYERLTPETVVGDNARPDPGWAAAPPSPSGSERITDKYYRNSGFARGHQAASADFQASIDWMEKTFTLANAVPQVQNGFNGGVWAQLERLVQDLAVAQRDIYVVTGPVALPADGKAVKVSRAQNACGREIVLSDLATLGKVSLCDATDDAPDAACDPGVQVPAALFKLIYLPDSGRAFAFLMPNEDHGPKKKKRQSSRTYLENWRISIDALEELTNISFFGALDTRTMKTLREQCVATRWR